MHVVWRRPDGFHGAAPTDFKIIEVAGQSRIWLHRSEREWFPFRVSGGWQDDDATKRLNALVNLLDQPQSEWQSYLTRTFHHSPFDDTKSFWKEMKEWLAELQKNLKGDTWETEIMAAVLGEISNNLEQLKWQFTKGADAK